MPPHAIVTGGAGFIGSHLVERLLHEGRQVTVIDDLSTGCRENLAPVADHPRLALVPSKVSACSDLESLVRRADAVFHLAATVGVEQLLRRPGASIDNNCRETSTLLNAAAQSGVPTLLASSSEVYGRSPREVLHEDDELILGPPGIHRWSYACSKLMGEFLALALAAERGLPVTIARIFNTVGPRQTGRHGMVVPRFVEAARAGLPLRVHGDGSQTRCFCAVHDTVEALIRLQQTPAARNRVVNVGSNQPISILDLAHLIRQRAASSSPIEFVPYTQAYGPGFEDLPRRRPDLSRLRDLTAFTPSTRIDDFLETLFQ